ncbi:hypothetical protein SESBI_06949 [Sesbania bispinosa]|nr:hypothetical protein SESBI_06949 [Sesbania bispinosa]
MSVSRRQIGVCEVMLNGIERSGICSYIVAVIIREVGGGVNGFAGPSWMRLIKRSGRRIRIIIGYRVNEIGCDVMAKNIRRRSCCLAVLEREYVFIKLHISRDECLMSGQVDEGQFVLHRKSHTHCSAPSSVILMIKRLRGENKTGAIRMMQKKGIGDILTGIFCLSSHERKRKLMRVAVGVGMNGSAIV